VEIEVDGVDWYEGFVICVLFGNLGDIFGGVEVFFDVEFDDGMFEFGVCMVEGFV